MNHENVEIFKTLNKDQIALFRKKECRSGEIIYRQGELCEEVGIVSVGELKITSYTHEGNEIVYNHIRPNMMFGNNLVFSSDQAYKGDVISLSQTTIYLIKKADLIGVLQENSLFLQEFLKQQSDITKQLNGQIKLLSIDSAEERFLYYIELNKGLIKYKTITALAAQLHLQRETLSRLISKLIKNKRIIKNSHVIEIIK